MHFVSHPWIRENAIEKRLYQEHVVRTSVTGNTLVVLPTGLGKTPIAAMVAAARLEKDMKSKILFMAPTKPLVEQHRKSFEHMLKDGLEMKTVTGSDKPEERSELYRKADVIFSTPQTTRNDLKKGILNLKDYSLLVVDEAHRAVGNYAYPYVAKSYISQSANPLILALTASPGSHKYRIDEVKQKLFISNVEIRTRDDSDVKPYVQKLEQEWVSVELPIPMKSIKEYLEKCRNGRMKKLFDWKIINFPHISKSQIIKLQEELARKKTGIGFAAMSLLAEVLKIDHALLLLETQCLHSLDRYFVKLIADSNEGKTRAVSRMVKDENFRNAMRLTTELIKENVEHPKIEKLKEIIGAELHKNKYSRIIIFAQYRDTISKIHEELKALNNAAPVEFIGQAKKRGKGLSQKEQVQILNEFKLGFYNILCASSVGEEGLDIAETDAVIFYEALPSAIRRIQRTGRTARTRIGKVIILITKDTRDEAYHWSGYQKEKKMTKMLYGMQRSQKALGDFHA